MSLAELTVTELIDRLVNGTTTNVEIVKAVLERIREVEGAVNAFITVRPEDELLAEAKAYDDKRQAGEAIGPLQGLPIAIKDSICTKGLLTTAASKMLGEFVPPFDATVIARIRQADGILLGKTNTDEFSMGSTTENSAFGVTRNPRNLDYVPGGSSGGSAAAVAAGEAPIALGADTGGSVRQPAAYCGIVGLKPTYGRISRFGLIAYASSLDQIGVCSRDVADAFLMLSVIAGHDPHDSTSLGTPVPTFPKKADSASLRVGVPDEYFGAGLDDEVRAAIQRTLDLMKGQGHTVVPISLPNSKYSLPTYYIIATAEASSNLARYDGVQYGHRTSQPGGLIDMVTNSRTEAFGDEVKRRIMLGNYVLSGGYHDQYYLKACKVRRLIADDFSRAFEQCDVIVHPIAPSAAFRLGEKTGDPLTMYLTDIYSVTANLAGLPALTLPCGTTKDGLPIGVQVVAATEQEETLCRASLAIEKLLREE
ncbi:MAG: Asp-tRNA(Asn)/Glu-tRNA(Gln) amidotransferase subunit GatA [Planctomycetaceae bacterium]|nr:Asp-tRNA(Asn)/Glu-tRNA(Gln) amidotransferase subunit GatA [Planctomycetaceae bacterium]